MNLRVIQSHATNFLMVLAFALLSATTLSAQSKSPGKPLSGQDNGGVLKKEWPHDNSPGDMNECFDNDLGGKLSYGDPDNLDFPTPAPDKLEFDLFGCLTPSFVDYDDLFSFHVPEGYSLTSMRFVALGPLFETPVNFYFWLGDDAQPVFEPDLSVEGIYQSEDYEFNLLNGLDLPLPSGWYTGWIEIGVPFSTTTYRLVFTLECADGVAPSFTSEAGSLDANLSCDDEATLEAVLDLKPEGFDIGGGEIKIDLVDDVTTEGGCLNTYTRVRTWEITDACGNVGFENFVQTIQVTDDTPPVLEATDAEVTITEQEGYVLDHLDVIVDAHDNCGPVNVSLNPEQVTCAQVNTVVPVTVTISDGCGNTTEKVVNVTVKEDNALKAPWSSSNIGNTANGSATLSVCSEIFAVKSKGFSTPQSDVLHFAYVDLCGDGEITARVSSLAPAGGWAGVMIRENLTPGAKKMAVKTNGSNAVRRDVRTTTNGATQMQQAIIVPGQHWVRINRTGNTISAYVSPDGVQAYTFLGAAQIAMGSCVMMGVFVESSNNNLEITGTFDNITISGGVQPLVMEQTDLVSTQEFKTSVNGLQSDDAGRNLPAGQLAKAGNLKAYPNPTSGIFNLDLSSYAGTEAVVRVFDATGKETFSKAVLAASEAERFDLSGFTPGLYLVRVEAENGQVQTLKLVFGDAVRE